MAIDWETATDKELLRACAGWLSQILNMICTTSLPVEGQVGSFYPRILYIPPTAANSDRIRGIVDGWKASDMRRFVAEFMAAGPVANEVITPIMHILDDRLVHEAIGSTPIPDTPEPISDKGAALLDAMKFEQVGAVVKIGADVDDNAPIADSVTESTSCGMVVLTRQDGGAYIFPPGVDRKFIERIKLLMVATPEEREALSAKWKAEEEE